MLGLASARPNLRRMIRERAAPLGHKERFAMAESLLKAGHQLSIWNRTRAKAEPLAKLGARVMDNLLELKEADILFSIVSTGKDLDQVYFGRNSISGHG